MKNIQRLAVNHGQRGFSTSNLSLLSPIKVGDLTLKNRIAFSSLNRMRADRSGPNQGVAKDYHVEYYSQRAKDAGLIISEGIPICKVNGHMGCLMMDN